MDEAELELEVRAIVIRRVEELRPSIKNVSTLKREELTLKAMALPESVVAAGPLENLKVTLYRPLTPEAKKRLEYWAACDREMVKLIKGEQT